MVVFYLMINSAIRFYMRSAYEYGTYVLLSCIYSHFSCMKICKQEQTKLKVWAFQKPDSIDKTAHQINVIDISQFSYIHCSTGFIQS